MRAAFFDVGDTLVEAWKEPALIAPFQRRRLVAALGERAWYDDFLAARHGGDDEDAEPQATLGWIRDWLHAAGVPAEDLDADRIRDALVLPLDEIGTLTPGAADALRWCHAHGLRVVLVTNTLWRGDGDVREDWRRFGLDECITGVASSHSVGWRKPHRAMYDRALAIAGCAPEEAFMVGDRLRADIWGAKQLGLRAVWRVPKSGPPQAVVDVRPDATVDELTELPAAVGPWLRAA